MNSQLIKLMENLDSRGCLRVLDQTPFSVQRIYFIDKMSGVRGGHRHKLTRQIMICARGKIEVYMNNGKTEEVIELDDPSKSLIIEPCDWHQMRNASDDALIVVLASHPYDPADYIHESYQ